MDHGDLGRPAGTRHCDPFRPRRVSHPARGIPAGQTTSKFLRPCGLPARRPPVAVRRRAIRHGSDSEGPSTGRRKNCKSDIGLGVPVRGQERGHPARQRIEGQAGHGQARAEPAWPALSPRSPADLSRPRPGLVRLARADHGATGHYVPGESRARRVHPYSARPGDTPSSDPSWLN
jgi:hypothetical protein